MNNLLNENDSNMLANSINHFQSIEHQENLNLILTKQNYILFSMLKPKLYKDGNEWCVLYGENIQEGIVGFGNTPLKAILDWNHQWSKED